MQGLDDWMDMLVRRVAHEIAQPRQFKVDMACTSYDPKTHTVKGIIVPHGIETGFVPIAAIHTSQQGGTGVFIGPRPGDASALQNGGAFSGDIMELHFDMGDPNTVTAKHKMSQPQNPPEVQAGEMLHLHEKGNKTLHAQDGSVTFTHFAAQGTQTWDKDGNLTTDTKGKTHTINASGGQLTINSGGGPMNVNTGGGAMAINTGGGNLDING